MLRFFKILGLFAKYAINVQIIGQFILTRRRQGHEISYGMAYERVGTTTAISQKLAPGGSAKCSHNSVLQGIFLKTAPRIP